MIDAQIGRTPDAVAFRAGDVSVSYRELGERANRLAHLLRRRGLVTGDRVGIRLHRGPDLVVTLLAVLKAGGCYVPLDPAYPPDRVAFMAKDSGARLILTGPPLGESLGTAEVLRLADIDTAGEPGHAPAVRVTADDLAYLIYTSGSTGRPKGVAIEHRSAAARLRWARTNFSDSELGGMLAATSVCFDLSVFEIFAPLAWGGQFVLVRNVLELATLSADADVRLVNTVPSAMSELLGAGAVPSSVRTVCLAGEPLPEALATRLWREPQIRRVLNLYGPSEDTTYSTGAELTMSDRGSPPIGRPLPGTTAYVLDDGLSPADSGELYLAGAGLARGYFAWPAETASRFLPDPFNRVAGQRMYRTGDRVRRRADGQLDYIGRADDQVKIRGFRVELGEVVAALANLPGIRQASAKAVRGPAGDLRLAGYVVAGDERPDSARVLADLRDRVPEHLVPSTLVWLDRLPFTPNGKVDRRELPDPEWDRPAVAAGGSVEDVIAGVWRDVLGVRAGPDDDFFALGGDSLLATRVMVRLRAELGVSLSLTALFEHSTVLGLAEQARAVPAGRVTTVLAADDATTPVSYAQQRLWFLDELTPNDPAYLINAVVWTRFTADPAHLEGALRDVVARHDALRTRFILDDDLAHHVQSEVDVVVRRAELARDEDVRRLVAEGRPMDLAEAPLARFCLLTRRGQIVGVLLTVHHIVFDAWSLDVFVHELGRCYDARVSGTQLEPVRNTRGFGAWQRTWMSSLDGRRALDRLAESLHSVPDVLDLPTDLPRPAEGGSAGAHLVLPIGNEAGLKEFARDRRVTLYMVGLAAFARLMADWSGQRDMVIGTAFAGRTTAEVDDAIGCFVNMVPVAIRTRPDSAGLLEEVRRAALFAAGHQDVPFECVVQRVRPARDMDRSPLVQVAFGVHAATRSAYRGEHARLEGHELEPEHARLDLTLWLQERPDGLHALWTYRTELFVPATISALHKRFITLLAEMTEPAAKET